MLAREGDRTNFHPFKLYIYIYIYIFLLIDFIYFCKYVAQRLSEKKTWYQYQRRISDLLFYWTPHHLWIAFTRLKLLCYVPFVMGKNQMMPFQRELIQSESKLSLSEFEHGSAISLSFPSTVELPLFQFLFIIIIVMKEEWCLNTDHQLL